MKRTQFLKAVAGFWIFLAVIIGLVIFLIIKKDTKDTTLNSNQDITESITESSISTTRAIFHNHHNLNLSSCLFPEAEIWISDGICDDRTNIVFCQYDGGDCCDPTAVTSFCNECLCKEEITTTTVNTTTTSEFYFTIPPYMDCPQHLAPYLGDGYCDDQANYAQCSFDNLDCCIGTEESQRYCLDCKCIDLPLTEGCNKDQRSVIYDGDCDDVSNTFACAWDGGDCCKYGNHYFQCTDCICYENGLNVSSYMIPPSSSVYCNYVDLKGDGICDELNNHEICDFDSGDCCEISLFSTCPDCECYGKNLRNKLRIKR